MTDGELEIFLVAGALISGLVGWMLLKSKDRGGPVGWMIATILRLEEPKTPVVSSTLPVGSNVSARSAPNRSLPRPAYANIAVAMWSRCQ